MAPTPLRAPRAPSNATSGLGVSKTNMNQIGRVGALQNIMNNPEQVRELGKALMPAQKSMGDYLTEKDKWLVAFKFFTDMAAQSSKPGATALGAAGAAGSGAVDFATGIAESKRKEDLAATQIGAKLLSSLSTKGKSIRTVKGDNVTYMSEYDAKNSYPENVFGKSFWKKFVPYKIDGGEQVFDASRVGDVAVNDAGQTLQTQFIYRGGQLSPGETTIIPGAKVASVDTGDFQDRLIYRTRGDAENYLAGKGFAKGTPGFDSAVERMVPPPGSEYLLDRPVITGDTFTGISFVSKGNKIIGANIGPLRGGATPRVATWAKKALENLAKNDNYIASAFDTEERIDQGLEILLNEKTLTGRWEAFSLPFRSFLANTFNFASAEDLKKINSQELIRSISFTLAPKMRPAGSGSTSDMEFRAYQQAIAALENTPLTNYLTLYTFKRVAENSRIASAKKLEVIESGGRSTDVENELDKIDRGIYERIESLEGESDDSWETRKLDFLKTLKRGDVIYNYDRRTGEKLYEKDASGNKMPDFIVSNGRGSYINFLSR
jgi:hypothetical protein